MSAYKVALRDFNPRPIVKLSLLSYVISNLPICERLMLNEFAWLVLIASMLITLKCALMKLCSIAYWLMTVFRITHNC